MSTRYEIVDIEGEVRPGIPTPTLMGEGGMSHYTDAFQRPDVPGIWYAKTPGYESPDGQYTRVKVRRVTDWVVKLTVQVIDHSYDLGDPDYPEPYTEDFWVEGWDRQSAEEAAMARAIRDAEDRYDSFDATDITIVNAREGTL